ncbi:hypothetical protein AAVH_36926, partial [Aphelenchoides avenae]
YMPRFESDYPLQDVPNLAFGLLKDADTFFKVAFANESLIDNSGVTSDYVHPPERAAIIRRVINGQPTYVFYGLLSKFRGSMGTRCGAFPDGGCYATPSRLNKASESLNGFLESFYAQLIDAFNKAASKLEQNEYSDDHLSICTPENVTGIRCEIK